jgi:hypothetical protein
LCENERYYPAASAVKAATTPSRCHVIVDCGYAGIATLFFHFAVCIHFSTFAPF